MDISLESKIEGFLYYKGEDVKIEELAKLLDTTIENINEALNNLDNILKNRGVVLVRKDNSVVLGINKELSPLITSIRKDEIGKELSKATLETLSIILYKNGITRSEIDYIRGVNSSFILRNLLVRGLIEKVYDEKDNRKILYHPTFETLTYMGISSIKELPNYDDVVSQLKEIIKEEEND